MWVLPVIACVAIVIVVMILRDAGQPRRFCFEGETFFRHTDGSFTRASGGPIGDGLRLRLQAHWVRRRSESSGGDGGGGSDWGDGGDGGGDGGGGD